jgi:hypothetical protein
MELFGRLITLKIALRQNCEHVRYECLSYKSNKHIEIDSAIFGSISEFVLKIRNVD